MKILLLLIYFGVTLLPLFIEAKSKRFDLFNLKNIFLLYLLFQIGVYEFVQFVFGIEASWYRASEYYVNYAILLAIVGTLSFQLFYYATPKIRFKTKDTVHRVHRQRIALYGLALMVFGYIMFLWLLSINGGLFEFLENLQSWRSEGISGQGIFIFPATIALSIGVILYASKYTLRPALNSNRQIKLVLMLIIALVPPSVIGFRGLILSPIIHFLIVFRDSLVTGISRLKATVLIIFAAAIFTAFGMYRQWSEVVTDRLSLFDGLKLLFEIRPELAFDVFLRSRGTDVVSTVISKLDATDQFIGFKSTLFEAIAILAPRSLIEKSGPLSVEFSKIFFGVNGGVSPTVIGELYWMGGILAVGIGMALFGFIAKIVYCYYIDNKSNLYSRLGYALFFVHFGLMAEAIQGNLNAMVLIFSFYLIVLFGLRLRLFTKQLLPS